MKKPSAAQRAAEYLTYEADSVARKGYSVHADKLNDMSAALLREDRQRRQAQKALDLCWPWIEKYADAEAAKSAQRARRLRKEHQ